MLSWLKIYILNIKHSGPNSTDIGLCLSDVVCHMNTAAFSESLFANKILYIFMSPQVYQPGSMIWISQNIFPTSRGDGGFPKVKLFM